MLALPAITYLILPVAALLSEAARSASAELLASHAVAQALHLTLVTTCISTALVILFGTPLALLLAKTRFPGKPLLQALVDLPITLPPVAAGVALLLAFGRKGWMGPFLEAIQVTLAFSTAAVILAQTFMSLPFYVRSASAGFAAVDPELEEAARTLGSGVGAVFLRITLPLSARAVFAGIVLAWARAVGEFGATLVFAGNTEGRTQTATLAVYAQMEQSLARGVFLAGALGFLALIVILVSRSIGGRRAEL